MSQLNSKRHYKAALNSIKKVLAVTVCALLLSGCAGSIDSSASGSPIPTSSRISECKINDRLIQNSSQCLQDDAACYQLSNNQWCTGERGASCPAGSVAMPEGMACPQGKRCFRVGETLECTIS